MPFARPGPRSWAPVGLLTSSDLVLGCASQRAPGTLNRCNFVARGRRPARYREELLQRGRRGLAGSHMGRIPHGRFAASRDETPPGASGAIGAPYRGAAGASIPALRPGVEAAGLLCGRFSGRRPYPSSRATIWGRRGASGGGALEAAPGCATAVGGFPRPRRSGRGGSASST